MFQQKRGPPYRPKHQKIMKYRGFALSLLDKVPLLKRALRHIWYDFTLFRYRKRWGKLKKEHMAEFDIDKIYWIEPERIRYASLKEFDIYKDKSGIIGGDWDRFEKRVEDLDVYIAFRQRFVDGERWEDTLFYQRTLDRMANGEFLWGRSKSDLDKRCKFLDTLYQNIKHQGYKTQSDILSQQEHANLMLIEDEIAVNVGRHGDLLFNNGAHRLCIAKLLGIEKIPVKISVRHPQWASFRRQILSYAEEHRGKIYHPITHLDFQDTPSFHGPDRFSIIEKNLSVRKGRLLDIGAHWGYFCHKFEEIGFDCYAVENDEVNVYFLEKLKRAENRHFEVIHKSIFEWQGIENLYFDVVLALNIFHHFLKDRTSYFELVNLLKKLNLNEMYFQPHRPTEFQGKDIYKNYSEEEFVTFIIQASKLTKAKLIGTAKDGRNIYKLWQ